MATRATKSLRRRILRHSILIVEGSFKKIKVPHRREGWHYEVIDTTSSGHLTLTSVLHRLTKKMWRTEIRMFKDAGPTMISYPKAIVDGDFSLWVGEHWFTKKVSKASIYERWKENHSFIALPYFRGIGATA